MARRALVIGLWGAVVAILLHGYAGSEGPRRPLRWLNRTTPPAAVGSDETPLRQPSWHDPTLRIADQAADSGACTGTAFAIDDDGHWLTAHHVVEGCRQLAILTAPRQGVHVVVAASHPRADVSLLTSGPSAPPLHLGSGALFLGQDGYSIGYPHGESGDVHEALIGRVRLRQRFAIEPGLLWAEIERQPNDQTSLAGLSGGPLVDRAGSVIGVTIAATPRRGRIASASPESIREVIARAGLRVPEDATGGTVADVATPDYGAFGDSLRKRASVARVLCWDRQVASRRPLVP